MTRPLPRSTKRVIACLLLLTATFAPIASGTETDTEAGDPQASQDTLSGHDCFESHAYFAGDPDDFEPAMPDGFSLVTDPNGDGTIVAVTRVCDSDTGPFTSMLAIVLVDVPAHRAWAGADHAILLSPSMVADARFHALLRDWGVTVPRLSPMTVDTHTLLDTVAESRTTADPDFVLTIQGADGPTPLPLARLRTFQMDLWTSEITAAYDSERQNVSAWSGPATAHSVSQGVTAAGGTVFIDAPSHRLGHGAIMVSPPTEIVFRPAPGAV